MKKKLSLLVALLMVLTLIPFNAFAVKTNFNPKQTVGDDDKNIPVSAVLEVEKADVASSGTVTVYLDEDAEFSTHEVEVMVDGKKVNVVKPIFTLEVDGKDITDEEATNLKFDRDNTFAIFNLSKDQLKDSSEVKIFAQVDLDDAKLGNQKWTINAEGVRLGKYERVYAVVESQTGNFSKRIGDVKTIGRGSDKQTATLELKAVDNKNIFEIKTSSDDFAWDTKNTIIVNADIIGVSDDNRTILIKAKKDKAVVMPVVTVKKGAPYGEVEFEITRGKNYKTYSKDTKKTAFKIMRLEGGKLVDAAPNSTGAIVGDYLVPSDIVESSVYERFSVIDDAETEYQVLAEYKEYGLQLKTKKEVKEVLVNGEEYSVDVELTSNDKTALSSKYYDFTVDGADVKVTNVSDGKLADDDIRTKADDEFTIEGVSKNKLTFTLKIKPDWDSKGEVKLNVTSRYNEKADCVVLKLKPVATIKTECKEILGGERKIAVNDVVITETEGGALKPGTRYAVSLQKMKFDYAKFEDKGKLEAEGIKIKDLKVDKMDQTIYFTVDGRSKKDAPAKIVLKDLQVVTDRALPLGNYELLLAYFDNDEEVAWKDVDKKDYYARTGDGYFELKEIATADFFKAVSELGRVKKTTVFTLGSADYTVDGAAMKLDNPVFTQDNYTMLPVRAIADALGVEVVWNQENKTATFIDGDKVVSITVNSKVLYKNGIAYPMATKSSVKADRMFISVASVGDAFGLNRGMDYIYDEAAKTVTIYPKAAKADMMEKADK